MAKGRLPMDEDDDEEEEEEEEFEDGEDVQSVGAGRSRDADGGSDEEEDDEEEGQDEYEKDGFIVDEDEEDGEEEEEEAKESSDEEVRARKKKRKKRDDNDELDEDDYELLREQNVVFHRPKSDKKNQFKRLKKKKAMTGDDDPGFSDDEVEDGFRKRRTAEEELKMTLFGDDEGVPPDDVGEEEEMEEEEEIGEEDDEMADFIVDEEEGLDDGQPFRRKKAKKKKAPRAAPGISSLALQEAQDIFGDVTALLDERRQRELEAQKLQLDMENEEDAFGRRKPSMLEKQFEPSLLEERFMTEKDDRIRDTDVPERLQELEEVAGPFPPSDSVQREAVWIYERAWGKDALLTSREFKTIASKEKDDIVRQIVYVLHLMHDSKLELPFIAMYRKEKCLDLVQGTDEYNDGDESGEPHLKHYEALWTVLHWDKRWLLLRRRKAGLEAAYEKRYQSDSHRGGSKLELFQKLVQAISDAQSEQAVDDVDAKFILHFPPDEVDLDPGQFKRPKRRSFYSLCRKSGLGMVADHFGLTPEKFGENISAMYKRHEVEDEASTPEDVANGHLGGEFRDALSVLKGARHMAAVEISAEPAVREYVRHMYRKAVISTRPSPQGNSVIDNSHQYASIKWLQNKPVDKFVDAQWLLIQKAEEEKLVEVTIGLTTADIFENLMPEFETVYLSEGVSRTAQLWNEQRKEILRDALLTMLLPAMEKEVRMALSASSKQWVAAECAKGLWNKVSVAQFTDPDRREEALRLYDGFPPRVLACCWGPGKPAITFVMLDSAGEIVNILYTGYLLARTNNDNPNPRYVEDRARLLEFIMDNQPHVVVLGTANLSCRRLFREIHEVVFKIMEDHPREMKGMDTINVVFGDDTIPQLYENSRISEEQLVGHPGNVRRAVALGRYLQSPLAMVATLCGPGKEVLSLELHGMQRFLSKEELYEAVEKVMVTVTNQVGLDINLAASHEWLFGSLQFVCGLGPRKASYIQRSIQSAGRIFVRKDLHTTMRMGPRTFVNSAGFIRVRGTGQASSGDQIEDPLDETRIHPESYNLAKRMAEDALCEEEQTNLEDLNDAARAMAIEHVSRNPQCLASMSMEVYASHLAKGGPITNLQTLQLIQMELQYGFQDWRDPFNKMSPEEEFHKVSGESEETLAEGCIVHATVREIQENRVLCVLESGLVGIINRNDLSDENVLDPAEKVTPGSIVMCRVKGFKKVYYQVYLSSKGSVLRGDGGSSRQQKDPYFKPDLALLKNEQEKAKKKSEDERRSTFKPRMIVHPQFQNVSLADATEALADKEVGEIIFRPSSKGPSHLSMTLKFFDGVYVNIDIVEGGKDSRDLTRFLCLGKTLTIGDETFEDLDEVIARYVDPLVSHLKEVLRYRKFKRGSKSEVDEALKQEKNMNPNRIPYFFSICHEHPGAFRLSYIKSVVTATHEYISVSPKGLKFRKRIFDGADKLVSYFQKHFSDPLPDVAPRRALAAMVPPRSPAPISSGSYRSGQWGQARSGEGAPSSGWDSSNGWDRSGGRSRTVGSFGGGSGSSGLGGWDQQPGGNAVSGSTWDLTGPSSQGVSGWNSDMTGSAPGGFGVGRVPPGPPPGPPPSGSISWDRQSQGQGDSMWDSRRTSAADSIGFESAGSHASTWDQPSERTPSRSGWSSEQELHGTQMSNWDEASGSRSSWGKQAPVRSGTAGWEQARGDPRRAGADREPRKNSESGWDQPFVKEAKPIPGWESSEPTSQSGGSSAMWEPPASSVHG